MPSAADRRPGEKLGRTFTVRGRAAPCQSSTGWRNRSTARSPILRPCSTPLLDGLREVGSDLPGSVSA